jgi:hypothetical protein
MSTGHTFQWRLCDVVYCKYILYAVFKSSFSPESWRTVFIEYMTNSPLSPCLHPPTLRPHPQPSFRPIFRLQAHLILNDVSCWNYIIIGGGGRGGQRYLGEISTARKVGHGVIQKVGKGGDGVWRGFILYLYT